jgi:drug/metabolite transporter (DMT)-like permease
MPGNRRWVALAGLVGAAGILGWGHVFARLAFSNGVNVITAATVRSVFAAFLLIVLLRIRREAVFPLSREGRLALLLGFFVAGQTAAVQAAVSLMPVTLAILVFYTFPFFIGVISSFLGSDRLTPALFLSLIAAFAGLTLVLGVGGESVTIPGVLAGLAASLCFTGALMLTPRLAPTLSAPLRTFLTMLTSAAIFVVSAVLSQKFHLPTNPTGTLGLVGLVICYAVGINLLFLCLPMLGPAQSAVVLNTEPVFVAIFAWLALGEGLSLLQVLGGAVVVGAVMWYQLVRARQAAKPA